MHPFALLAAFAALLATAHAAIYVTNPVQSTACSGGQSCDVAWVDDGTQPLVSSIGECNVALYTGNYVLVQTLNSVDVSTTSSLSFVPSPNAGPIGQYYLVFTSTTIDYQSFSADFTLNGMSGTTPSGGSSTTPAPTTTPTGSSTSPGSSTPGTSPTGTATTTGSSVSGSGSVTGTSTTPSVSVTTPTASVTASGTTTPSVTPSSLTIYSSSSAPTTSPTSTSPTKTTATVTASTTASATPSNAAGRVGSPVSLGSIAALFVLTGALAF